MPSERIAMRQVRDIVRLKSAGVALREIAGRIGVAPSTVRLTLQWLVAAGLNWPLPDDLTDAALEAKLFANAGSKQGHRRSREPDWAEVHRALKRKHVTLSIVWEEYIAREPDGYRYSRFCELYRGWEGRLSVTMRQSHAAGEKLFIDYAGDGVPIVVDRLTGEIRNAQIFVAVLGASNFTFAQATWTQGVADWIGSHASAFEAIGGVPQLLVPDNTRTAVIKACLYDPQIKPHLRRYGGALWCRHPTGEAQTAARQGEGRTGRACHRALASRPNAQPYLLQSRRGQRRDRRAAQTAQRRTAHPPSGRDTPPAARRDRPAGAQSLAGRALHLGRMAHPPCRHRLPRGSRGTLLQRPLSLRASGSRSAAHRPHRRDLPQRRADRRPSAHERQSQAHHHSRTHALQPSPLSRLDHSAHSRRCAPHRTGDRCALRLDLR